MQLTSIRWIAFDAVGTLIFADPPVHLAYFRIGAKFGSRLSPAEVRSRFQRVFNEHRQSAPHSGIGEADERSFWRAVVGDVFADIADIDACFEELFDHFANPESWQCFADVEETLDELAARGYRLAIASNFDARLHRICDDLTELAPIATRIISSQVGAAKPHPDFYKAILSACECREDELLMIGDDSERDVAAPRRLGITAWELSRGAPGGSDVLGSLSDTPDRLPHSIGPG